MNKLILVVSLLLSVSSAIAAGPPTLEEQRALFRDLRANRFEIPTPPTLPGFDDSCWFEFSKWKRIGMFHTTDQVTWDNVGAGFLKFVAFYRRSDEARCQSSAREFMAFEQTFHETGPYTGLWALSAEPTVGNTFTFFSRYLFRDRVKVAFYREDCRMFHRAIGETQYMVCRVINQDADQNPGFIGLLTYEPL